MLRVKRPVLLSQAETKAGPRGDNLSVVRRIEI